MLQFVSYNSYLTIRIPKYPDYTDLNKALMNASPTFRKLHNVNYS